MKKQATPTLKDKFQYISNILSIDDLLKILPLKDHDNTIKGAHSIMISKDYVFNTWKVGYYSTYSTYSKTHHSKIPIEKGKTIKLALNKLIIWFLKNSPEKLNSRFLSKIYKREIENNFKHSLVII